MILDKIRGFLGLKKKGDEKEIVISCERLERRVAVLEGGRLEEFSIERESDRQISGSIYKGKVKNLEPGLKAMFVDIGLDKNAFLHYWDAIPAALDAGVEAIERQRRQAQEPEADHRQRYSEDLSARLRHHRAGDQGARSAPRARASRPTSASPGRYLVLMPYSRPVRHLAQDRGPQGTPAPAPHPAANSTCPTAWASSSAPSAKARRRASSCAICTCCSSNGRRIAGDLETARAPKLLLRRARPDRAHRARLPHRRSRPHRGRRPRRGQPDEGPRRHHLQALAAQDPATTPKPCRSSSASTSTSRSTPRCAARSGCPAAATSSSTRPRRSSPSTSTPAATRAARTRTRPSSRPTSRRRRKSRASCACATSAA